MTCNDVLVAITVWRGKERKSTLSSLVYLSSLVPRKNVCGLPAPFSRTMDLSKADFDVVREKRKDTSQWKVSVLFYFGGFVQFVKMQEE
jgi:hypothetical protein